jgi:hypothetical protein
MHANKKKEIRLTDDGTRKFEIDELEKGRGVSRGLYEASFVQGRVGHCDVGERRREGCILQPDWREREGRGRVII